MKVIHNIWVPASTQVLGVGLVALIMSELLSLPSNIKPPCSVGHRLLRLIIARLYLHHFKSTNP